uniref:Thioredoxin domain-containing protein n=1 Tax=Amblyomma maculatum TaxID=34609 RepID=G3MQJ9_AMBMU
MAVSSSSMAIPSCNLRRPFSANTSMLSALRSVGSSPLPLLPPANSRISALPQRRIMPKVQAKKQTFSSFDDLLKNSDKPVLVDFYATWCGPCQFMVPVLEQVSDKMKDTIQVVKIDTEKYTQIANQYKIAALPTLILFRNGKPFDRFEGAMTADQLVQRIENALKVPQ